MFLNEDKSPSTRGPFSMEILKGQSPKEWHETATGAAERQLQSVETAKKKVVSSVDGDAGCKIQEQLQVFKQERAQRAAQQVQKMVLQAAEEKAHKRLIFNKTPTSEVFEGGS